MPSNSPYAKVKGAYELTISPEGDIVHRDAVEALLKALNDLGFKDIAIGEASGGCETPVIYKALALYELAEEYGVKLVDLNYEESVKVEIPDPLILDYVWVPKVLLNSDLKINLAALKAHGHTVVTLCLKNWGIGIPPAKYYGSNKAGSRWKGMEGSLPIHGTMKVRRKRSGWVEGQEVAVSQVMVDVCKACKPDLNIIDGFTVVDYKKFGDSFLSPTRVREANMVLASYNVVAIDAVATRVMRLNPQKVLHIRLAQEQGLGPYDISEIDVVGERIEDVQTSCNPLRQQRGVILSH
jgi:uncharacterized protein (DUF362 family)